MPIEPLKQLASSIITDAKFLLVEGQDEVKFFEALLKHLNLKGIQIYEVGGKDNLHKKFPAFLRDPHIYQVTAYAIIRDADANRASAFESIKRLLQSQGQPCPATWNDFAVTDSLKVGIFIMPGNAETGMLESLCLQTIANHPIMPCVESFMQCLEDNLERKLTDEPKDRGKAYYPKNEEKARMHIFLSARHEVTTSIGLAAQRGYWSFDHEALADLRSFLQQLAE